MRVVRARVNAVDMILARGRLFVSVEPVAANKSCKFFSLGF